MPPLMQCVDYVMGYDADGHLATTKILQGNTDKELECSAQCVCVEATRLCLARGWDGDYLNNQVSEEWEALITEATERAKIGNLRVPVYTLTRDQCEGGTQRAANYITEGYQAYLEATDPGDYLTFSRAGGILQGM